jgi:TIR domain
MADVFISYRSNDRELVAPVAKHLAELGLDVWFDQKIRVGEHWDAEIEERLKKSRVVVVCWSHQSVQSPWVMWEATYAQQAGSIVPAFFDTSAAPGPLSRVRGAQLADWQGEATHEGWSKLVAEISRLLARPDLIRRRHYNAVRPHESLGYRPPAPEVFVPALAAWPSARLGSAPTATLSPASRPGLN